MVNIRNCNLTLLIKKHKITKRTFSQHIPLSKQFNNTSTFTSYSSKEILWNKNVSIEDKIKFFNNFKKNNRDDVAETIQVCLLTTNACFMMKREKEFRECLNDLKYYCEKLSDEKKLDEKSWNFIIQHFCREESFHSFAIYLFNRIMKERELVTSNLFTLTAILKVCSGGHVEIQFCEQIVNALEQHGAMNVFLYSHFINNCIVNDDLEKALSIVLEMKKKCVEPNYAIYIPLLKSATVKKNISVGVRVCEIVKNSNMASPQLSMTIIAFALKAKKPELVIEQIEIVKRHQWMTCITWNCLIQAHIQMNNINKAIECISEMKVNNIHPDSATFTILLTSCADSNLFEDGKLIHELANDTLKHHSIELHTAIVNFYTKCGYPEIAIKECEQIKSKRLMNAISWSCLIQAYTQKGDIEKSMQIINEMKDCNLNPNSRTFTILMTACSDAKLFEEGKSIHKLATETLKDEDDSIELSTTIVNFYTKCGYPEIAIEECEKMQTKGLMNVISFTCLIQAFIQNGEIQKAIQTIMDMKTHKVTPNSTTFSILLTACADSKLFEEGKLIHEMAIDILKDHSLELLTAIVSFYTKCGYPEIAIKECEQMKSKGLMDIISCNCMLQAYIQMNEVKKAIEIFHEIRESGLNPSSTTFSILLTACANANLFEEGKLVHKIAVDTLKDDSGDLLTTIVNFYTKCGHIELAINECENMKTKGLMNNIVIWNCLIQAYIKLNEITKAIQSIQEMKGNNVTPDSITFTILLTACANSNLFEEGKSIHEQVNQTLVHHTLEVYTSIVNFYTKCGYPEIAIMECEKMKSKGLMDVASWNCLIQAYIQNGETTLAVQTLYDMKENDTNPNCITFAILLTACADSNLFGAGKLIHEQATHLKVHSFQLSTSIVNFYSKCGHPEIAIEECEKLKSKRLMNHTSLWNCFIKAHIQLNGLNNAMKVFEEMKKNNINPDEFTYVTLLSSCGDFVATKIGLQLINEIKLKEMNGCEEIASAMIYYYSRIGDHETAQELFENLIKSQGLLSIITYNSMLSCCAQNGRGEEAIILFNEMVERKVEINEQTFTIMLNTFSNCGLVEKAIQFYEEIKTKYKHNPSKMVDCVMVEVCSHAGRFNEAEMIINERRDYALWNALMSGCRKFNNIELAEKAFKILTIINEKQATPYILLSQIYSYHQLNEKVDYIRQLMIEREIKKPPGIVYHEEDGKLYQFISGSKDYERFEEIEEMRKEINRKILKAGFEPDTSWVTNSKQLTEDEKLDSLGRHAEKTAIAHAFVLNPNRKSIILSTNLRVCNDCHSASEFISKEMDVEIIIRDSNRLHHFNNGKCSCARYW